MSETMKSTSVSEEELSKLDNAGASSVYISYYKTAKEHGFDTSSTSIAEEVIETGEKPYPGGSFHEALWNNEVRYKTGSNPFGADSTNQTILELANVFPYSMPDE
jgi:hypothetical protein